EKLQAGELALGIGLRQARTVDIAHIAKTCGFDWLFIDMEHNSMDVDAAAQICAGALTAGVTPIIRVPGHESYHATRLLDAGAMGIVVPHVSTAAEATHVANACRFPPAGHRSIPGLLPQVGFESLPLADVVLAINRETLLVVMIETKEGLENVDAIAAVPGIDVLLVGCNDLAAELGVTGQLGHAKIAAAIDTVCAACVKHGKYPGVGGVYDDALMKFYIQKGARFILSGSDLAFLIAGAKARTGMLRDIPLTNNSQH
ncbi:MAG: aldolase/citrate lyase family protein, partial [Burkholderiales bacterium]